MNDNMKNEFLRLLVVRPNGENDVVLIDMGEKSYPKGTQPHAYIHKRSIVCVEPAPMTQQGIQLPGSEITVFGKQGSIRVYQTVEEIMSLLDI